MGAEFKAPLTICQVTTQPSAPESGELKIYAKLDNKIYKMDEFGTEVELGAGAGGSGDMLKTTYDTDNDGRVDQAEQLSDGTTSYTPSQIATQLSGKVNTTTTVNTKALSSNVTLTQDDVGNGSTYVRTTNDYTTTEKNKLAGIEAGANVNNISNANATTLTGGSTADTLHKHISVKDSNASTGVSQIKMYTCTQAEYDAIGTKDSATLYIIR
jgi:hypothetical protein